MSKGYSFTTQPFAAFQSSINEGIFNNWFVHDRILAVNISQFPKKGGIQLSGWWEGKGNNLRHRESVGLWFPIGNRDGTLYFKSFNDELKIHYDDGIRTWKDAKNWLYNPFMSFQSSNQLKNIVLKAGVNVMGAQWNIGSRIRYSINEEEGQVSMAKRASWAEGPWCIASYKAVNLNKMIILTNGLKVSWKKGDNQGVFTAQQNDLREIKNFKFSSFDSYFNLFNISWIRQLNAATKAGINTQVTSNGLQNVDMVIRKEIVDKNALWKVRLSSKKSLALCYKAQIKDYGSWTVGFEISDLGKSNIPKYGLQLDLNL